MYYGTDSLLSEPSGTGRSSFGRSVSICTRGANLARWVLLRFPPYSSHLREERIAPESQRCVGQLGQKLVGHRNVEIQEDFAAPLLPELSSSDLQRLCCSLSASHLQQVLSASGKALPDGSHGSIGSANKCRVCFSHSTYVLKRLLGLCCRLRSTQLHSLSRMFQKRFRTFVG